MTGASFQNEKNIFLQVRKSKKSSFRLAFRFCSVNLGVASYGMIKGFILYELMLANFCWSTRRESLTET